jgi:MFS family permease
LPDAEIMSSKLQGRTARGAAATDLACMYMGSTLVTPLYVLYEEAFDFSELTLTLIFAAYAFGNIASLFVFGRLSDQIGRRRTALPAIGVAVLATLVFLFAAGTAWLFVARVLSGLAIGMASAAAAAWVVDLTRNRKEQRGAAITTGAIFSGLAIAVLAGGLLAQYAPAPLKLPFVIYLVVLAVLAFVVSRTKDTVEDRAESLEDVSLEPRIGVPREIRGRFVSPAVTAFAAFAVSGFYAALAPSLLRRDMEVTNLAVAGAIVCGLFVCAAITAVWTSGLKSRTAMLAGASTMVAAVVLLVAAQMLASLPLLVIGALVTGIATALGYRGSLQVVNEIAPKAQRAEVIASFKIVCFSGNAVPVIGVGVISAIWSPVAATVSLAAVATLLAVVALVTEMGRGRKRGRAQASAR